MLKEKNRRAAPLAILYFMQGACYLACSLWRMFTKISFFKAPPGEVFPLIGGFAIVFSGILMGLVSWGAYRFPIAMFLVVFTALPQLAFGILVSISAIVQRRAAILISSVISLLWSLFFAIIHIDWIPYLLACLIGVSGSLLSMFGGFLLEKKEDSASGLN